MPRRSAATAPHALGGVNGHEPDAPLGKVLGFLQALWSVSHGLQSLSKHMEATVGVTAPQRIALRIIGRQPGLSPGRLADILCLSPATLTGVLQRLEQRGLVSRRSDPNDSRRSLLELTTEGQRLADRRAGTVEGAVRRALLRLDAREVDVVVRVLWRVAKELDSEITLPRGGTRRDDG